MVYYIMTLLFLLCYGYYLLVITLLSTYQSYPLVSNNCKSENNLIIIKIGNTSISLQ